jgi:hypothetical protein
MRIFAAVIIWITFLGGLTLYMKHRGSVEYSNEYFHEWKSIEKVYALEVTPSFVPEPDPFALSINNSHNSTALLVRVGEHEILKVDDSIADSETFVVEPLHGLVAGKNEIYVEASPPFSPLSTQNAVRVRIIENGHPLAEKTFWSPPGNKVSGTFEFILNANGNDLLQEEHGNP